MLSLVSEITKHCPKCKEEKLFSDFGKDITKKIGLTSYCKLCAASNRKLNYAKNPNKEKKKLMEYYNSNKEKFREYSLKSLYGASIENYKEMQTQQGHMCKICKTHESNLKRKLFIDHCHETGKVRGLLCQYCNTMLGNAKDNMLVLQSAINYLANKPLP
jgi:hypothetical protein